MLLSKVKALSDEREARVSEELKEQPKSVVNVVLKPHQLVGLNWLKRMNELGIGCILGDEMGLGKTLQCVSLMAHLVEKGSHGPFLVVCPLSVIDTWLKEAARSCPRLSVFHYGAGTKAEREEFQELVQDSIKQQKRSGADDATVLPFQVLVTSYEYITSDQDFLASIKWQLLVFDEAQRLKNSNSAIAAVLSERYSFKHKILLTGTPVQNNVTELWSLLHFLLPKIFTTVEAFNHAFGSVQASQLAQGSNAEANESLQELQAILALLMLRRVKIDVGLEIPAAEEVVIYTGMTELQKRYYKSLLVKNADAVLGNNPRALMNIMMSLRKACNHPYLFQGAEPEPFQEGDHLWQASGKFILLDRLLPMLKNKGRRVLIFSQSTQTLDILQDYLTYRSYTYERLDGSVRGEERFAAVKRFQGDVETFIFILSTRAGGVGLNLEAADTVIFLDSDWNPQVDLQAQNRVHRIGQKKEVLIIRLVTSNTIEEVIEVRRKKKLLVSNAILSGNKGEVDEGDGNMRDAITFGLERMDDSAIAEISDEAMRQLLAGKLKSLSLSRNASKAAKVSDLLAERSLKEVEDPSIYYFEGKDMKEAVKQADREQQQQQEFEERVKHGRESWLRIVQDNEAAMAAEASSIKSRPAGVPRPPRVVVPLTEEEKLERKKRKEELTKLKEQLKQERAEAKMKRIQEMWKENGYISTSVGVEADLEEDDDNVLLDEDDEAQNKYLHYVLGDASHPETQPTEAEVRGNIILHAVDNSGRWGRGGFFTALANVSVDIGLTYERASAMQDLHLGDLHLVQVSQGKEESKELPLYVGLAIVQKHSKAQLNLGFHVPSIFDMASMAEALKKASSICRDMKLAIHMPRLSSKADTSRSEWYATERLVKKLLVAKHVHTFVYYFPRHSRVASLSGSNSPVALSRSNSPIAKAPSPSHAGSKRSASEFLLQEEPVKAKEEKVHIPNDHDDNLASKFKQGLERLPQFLKDAHVYADRLDEAELRRTRRWVLAFGGSFDTVPNNHVTHIITSQYHRDAIIQSLVSKRKVLVTRVDWLDESAKKMKLLIPSALE